MSAELAVTARRYAAQVYHIWGSVAATATLGDRCLVSTPNPPIDYFLATLSALERRLWLFTTVRLRWSLE